MMESIALPQLWTVVAVLAGFQVTALYWRINRELVMEAGGITWLTCADGFVGASFLVLVGGVFVAPMVSSVSTITVVKLFGLALVLFAPSVFVLAGHYNLYCAWGKPRPRRRGRGRVTKQESVAVVVALVLLTAYITWYICCEPA